MMNMKQSRIALPCMQMAGRTPYLMGVARMFTSRDQTAVSGVWGLQADGEDVTYTNTPSPRVTVTSAGSQVYP